MAAGGPVGGFALPVRGYRENSDACLTNPLAIHRNLRQCFGTESDSCGGDCGGWSVPGAAPAVGFDLSASRSL
jgi:hypothetical protein